MTLFDSSSWVFTVTQPAGWRPLWEVGTPPPEPPPRNRDAMHQLSALVLRRYCSVLQHFGASFALHSSREGRAATAC